MPLVGVESSPEGIMASNDIGPATPAGLGDKGARLWAEVTGGYKLRHDELDVLEDVCREADLIDKIEHDLVTSDLLVGGSQGQLVVNPLVSEARQHRATKMSLWKRLALPDPVVQAEASNQQRAAAQSRWGAAHGAGA